MKQLNDVRSAIDPALAYGQPFSYTFDNGTRYGRYVSIHRFDDGAYERPISYNR